MYKRTSTLDALENKLSTPLTTLIFPADPWPKPSDLYDYSE